MAEQKQREKRRRSLALSIVRGLALLLVVLAVAGAAALSFVYSRLKGSLPVQEGELRLPGLSAPVTVSRDAYGVATVEGQNRLDVSRALGFLHAQERFFQMDTMRRRAAGELAELFGKSLLPADRASRVHRLRRLAEGAVTSRPAKERLQLEAYSEGINAGLGALEARPFEYWLLGEDPVPWRPEDSVLVVYSMFLRLDDPTGRRESTLGVLHDTLPEELADFLAPPGTEWDAPVVGEAFQTPDIPPASVLDLRQRKAAARNAGSRRAPMARPPAFFGSNNWAVAGSRTVHGGALLANDMHLGLSVPNTWYRVMMQWPDEPDDEACRQGHRVVGVSLPGTPVVTVGSNTHVAWGFTNSQADWVDLVVVETDPTDPDRYLTPEGYRHFERHMETINVRGDEPEAFEITSTVWGPVIDLDHRGRPRASRWIAHDIESVNMNLLALDHVQNVEGALAVAARTRIPPQNFVCTDEQGNIGWTIMGRIPRRRGFDGRFPASWADGERRWDGWLDPDEYPRVVNPPSGLMWTANARVVSGEMLARIGDGGYALGARARQIRDDLLALDKATPRDLLEVQLDDRALFLGRWRELLLDLLQPEDLDGHPDRNEVRRLVKRTWTGRASVDSVAYRLVRAFRLFTFEEVYGWLTAACRQAGDAFDVQDIRQWEGPLW
ncbi:MAG: penicillin acylase family protein, partial [Acidobacteriota bacterium]